MSEKYTMLQICIICILAFILGTGVLLRHSNWFDGEYGERAITLRTPSVR